MIAPADRRLEFLTGFTGSAGTAVVTDQLAALWTDGRYLLQADHQLDCHWMILELGKSEMPTIGEWLLKVLQKGDHVGADAKLVSADQWLDWHTNLGTFWLIV